jgi:hypothetical protein
MWIFTTDGFFSAVADRDDADMIVVRSRVWADTARFTKSLGFGVVVETPEADYGFRVRVPRSSWVEYVTGAAKAIDYANFKAAIAVRQGSDRAHIYADVWSVMRALQTAEERQ